MQVLRVSPVYKFASLKNFAFEKTSLNETAQFRGEYLLDNTYGQSLVKSKK